MSWGVLVEECRVFAGRREGKLLYALGLFGAAALAVGLLMGPLLSSGPASLAAWVAVVFIGVGVLAVVSAAVQLFLDLCAPDEDELLDALARVVSSDAVAEAFYEALIRNGFEHRPTAWRLNSALAAADPALTRPSLYERAQIELGFAIEGGPSEQTRSRLRGLIRRAIENVPAYQQRKVLP